MPTAIIPGATPGAIYNFSGINTPGGGGNIVLPGINNDVLIPFQQDMPIGGTFSPDVVPFAAGGLLILNVTGVWEIGFDVVIDANGFGNPGVWWQPEITLYNSGLSTAFTASDHGYTLLGRKQLSGHWVVDGSGAGIGISGDALDLRLGYDYSFSAYTGALTVQIESGSFWAARIG